MVADSAAPGSGLGETKLRWGRLELTRPLVLAGGPRSWRRVRCSRLGPSSSLKQSGHSLDEPRHPRPVPGSAIQWERAR